MNYNQLDGGAPNETPGEAEGELWLMFNKPQSPPQSPHLHVLVEEKLNRVTEEQRTSPGTVKSLETEFLSKDPRESSSADSLPLALLQEWRICRCRFAELSLRVPFRCDKE